MKHNDICVSELVNSNLIYVGKLKTLELLCLRWWMILQLKLTQVGRTS